MVKVGMMNNPEFDPVREISFAARNGFDFIDLTLEGLASPEKLKVNKVVGALEKFGLGVVGHTDWHLPYTDQVIKLRKASFSIFEDCLKIFKQVGVKKMNVHPVYPQGMVSDEFVRQIHVSGLKKLVKTAKQYKVVVMLENCEPNFSIEDVSFFLKNVPGLGFHLDVGHANLWVKKNMVGTYLKRFSKRLKHVHLSDNFGKDDLHLPIGAGSIDWREVISLLKRFGYDGSVSLEIFSPDRDYLLISREKFLELWK